MVVGFPIAKLATLVIKQVSKPLATGLKNRAKSSHLFRTYVLMPPAQFYHWCEVRMKMYVMNMGRSKESAPIPRLNEDAAIELGANLLGEGVIFGIAVAILGYEVLRQKEKDRNKEEQETAFINNLENRVNELTFSNEELDTKIRELTRVVYAAQHQIKVQGDTASDTTASEIGAKKSQNKTNESAIIQAVVDAKSRIKS